MPQNLDIIQEASISLLIDSYDAIFSDFDPRPLTKRTISDDFLTEAQKVVRDSKEGVFELRFLIPKHLHNPHDEQIVKERLHHHFHFNEQALVRANHGVIVRGVLLAILGFIIMFAVSFGGVYERGQIWYELLRVVGEPAGWFLAWYGLDQIFYFANEKSSELNFYRKMAKAVLVFDTY